MIKPLRSLLVTLFAFTAGCLITTAQTPEADADPVRPAARNIMPSHSAFIAHTPNPTAPPKEIATKIDVFFKALKGGGYSQAYESLLQGTRLGSQKDKVSLFISKTQEAFGIYGGLNDYELYDTYSIGSNVLVITYLTRHSVQPLRWRFIYYRADTEWNLNNLGFDDYLLDLLD